MIGIILTTYSRHYILNNYCILLCADSVLLRLRVRLHFGSVPFHSATRCSTSLLRASRSSTSFHSIPLILPELVADVFKHHNRIPRARRDILRHDVLIYANGLRKPHAYHTIRVVRVNFPECAVGHRLVLRVVFVV